MQPDRIISPLIEQGQYPYQIVTNRPELALSVRTVYAYLDQVMNRCTQGAVHLVLDRLEKRWGTYVFLTQWDVNLFVSHINSTPQESLGGRTPYRAALETMGEDVLNAFQLRSIAPDEVNLTPKMIRFNYSSTARNLLSDGK